MSRIFLDTNICVYADDGDAGPKQAKAQGLIRSAFTQGHGVLSTQVLQEYFVIATRKLGMPAEIAQQKVQLLASLNVVEIRVSHIVEAIKLHRLYGLSFWDALVVHAALSSGCTQVFSEDLQHGMRMDGLEIINPFLA